MRPPDISLAGPTRDTWNEDRGLLFKDINLSKKEGKRELEDHPKMQKEPSSSKAPLLCSKVNLFFLIGSLEDFLIYFDSSLVEKTQLGTQSDDFCKNEHWTSLGF